MIKDEAKLPACPYVIRIPWLCDVGVGSSKLPDEGEDPDNIVNHGEGVHLGHTLLAMQKVAWHIPGVL